MKDSTAESLSRLPSRRVVGYDRFDSTDTKAEDTASICCSEDMVSIMPELVLFSQTILNDVRRIVISHVGWDIWNNEVSTLNDILILIHSLV